MPSPRGAGSRTAAYGAPLPTAADPSDDSDFFKAKGRPARGGLRIEGHLTTDAPRIPSAGAPSTASSATDLSGASPPPRLRQPDFDAATANPPTTHLTRERGGPTPMHLSRSTASRQAQLQAQFSWLSGRLEAELEGSHSKAAEAPAEAPAPSVRSLASPLAVASPEAMGRVAALDPDRSNAPPLPAAGVRQAKDRTHAGGEAPAGEASAGEAPRTPPRGGTAPPATLEPSPPAKATPKPYKPSPPRPPPGQFVRARTQLFDGVVATSPGAEPDPWQLHEIAGDLHEIAGPARSAPAASARGSARGWVGRMMRTSRRRRSGAAGAALVALLLGVGCLLVVGVASVPAGVTSVRSGVASVPADVASVPTGRPAAAAHPARDSGGWRVAPRPSATGTAAAGTGWNDERGAWRGRRRRRKRWALPIQTGGRMLIDQALGPAAKKWALAAAGGVVALLIPSAWPLALAVARRACPLMLHVAKHLGPRMGGILARVQAAAPQPAGTLVAWGRGSASARLLPRRRVAATTAAVSTTAALHAARLFSRAAKAAGVASKSGTIVAATGPSTQPALWQILRKVSWWLAQPLIPSSWLWLR